MSRVKLQNTLARAVKQDSAIHQTKYNDDFYIDFARKSLLEQLCYFSELGIIHNNSKCICDREIFLINKSRVIDGHVWFCKIYRKEKTCKNGSIFEYIKTSVIKLFKAFQNSVEIVYRMI
ncbi:hypothetical protein DMUE_0404 [Dictyocoela muelleri]|nr:hypothetical protein DMUE_0404 [Dictyocoela muelleri]